ncbi:MAG: branched-chain amino acid ABC transporter permease [Candidatus Bathyarchaeia archaeon]
MAEIAIILEATINGLLMGGIYALLAAGLSLMMGVMRVVNLAHGDLMMIGMYVTFWIFTLLGIHPFISIAFSVPILFIVGVVIQKGLIEPGLELRLPQEHKIVVVALVTIGLSMIIQNLVHVIWTADYRSVIIGLTGSSLEISGIRIGILRLLAFSAAFLMTACLQVCLKRTRWGKSIRAIAQDEEAAMCVGINVPRYRLLTFGLGSSVAGAAGSLMALLYYIFPAVGTHLTIYALVIVTLGGIGSILGSFLGGLTMGLVESIASLYLGIEFREVVAFIIFILVLALRPAGLLGEKLE